MAVSHRQAQRLLEQLFDILVAILQMLYFDLFIRANAKSELKLYDYVKLQKEAQKIPIERKQCIQITLFHHQVNYCWYKVTCCDCAFFVHYLNNTEILIIYIHHGTFDVYVEYVRAAYVTLLSKITLVLWQYCATACTKFWESYFTPHSLKPNCKKTNIL